MQGSEDSFYSEVISAHFQVVANASSDAIVTIDERSIVLFANAAVQRIFGYSREELTGQALTILMPEYLRHVHEAGLTRYVHTGEKHINWERVELPALHRSGRDLTVEVSFGQFSFDSRTFFTGVIRDVTARKRTEAREQMEAAVLRVLTENFSTAEVPTKVLEVVCTHLKWKVGQLWIFDPAEALLKHAAAWSEDDAQLKRFVEHGAGLRFEEGAGLPGYVLSSAQSQWIPDLSTDLTFTRKKFAVSAGLRSALVFPVRVAGHLSAVLEFCSTTIDEPDDELIALLNTIAGYIGQFIERRRAEEQREALLSSEQKARETAEHANRLKDEFLTTVSHELRTPMTAIMGWSGLLREGLLNEERTREAVQIICRNASTQTRLVDDLLDLSAIITGKVRLNIQPLYVMFAVKAAIDSIQPAATAKGIHIDATLDPSAGPVSGDADRLQQIAWNLLSNAVKFTPKNGRIYVVLEKTDSHVELQVSDNGLGISAEFLPHVFDRFRQADASSTRDQGGMGIGLAIVRHLVEMHGGGVKAESSGKGHGATFTVQLPLRVAHHVAPSALGPQQAVSALGKAPELKNLRVLVVDDHPETTALVQIILESHGADVTTAHSADQALTIMESAQTQLLISDIGMPGKDGYTLIRDIRKDQTPFQHIPALALTAYARDEDRSRILWAGFDAHLAKPITSETLVAVVATLARRIGKQPIP